MNLAVAMHHRLTIALLLSVLAVPGSAFAARDKDGSGPLTLIHATPLPEISGDFDHFAVDAKRNHLFVSAEVHHSVEMFDLRTGEHLQSLSGFKTPHSLAFSPEKDELMVCDGGDSALILVAAGDFHHIDRIPLIDGSATGKGDSPDAAYYDAANRLYYIGNGGASANLPDSTISIFSVDSGKLLDAKFTIPGNNVESMGVDNAHHRLYVNIRDKQQVGVFDLNTKEMITSWTAPGLDHNTALFLDAKDQRIFVAGRKPGILYVFDANGKVVAQMPCADVNDDMSFDPATKRLYVSGTQGLSVFQQNSPDSYTELLRLPTNGAKTSFLMPSLKQFYAAHPKNALDDAGLLVFHINE